jgi:holo-[acyl-carrier protein] synthase
MGIGIDIVNVEEFTKCLKFGGDRVLNKIFTNNEIHFCKEIKKNQLLAANFAAKEAFLKSLGIGLFSGIQLYEIEIIFKDYYSPIVHLHKDIADIECGNQTGFFISISYTKKYAIAAVVRG